MYVLETVKRTLNKFWGNDEYLTSFETSLQLSKQSQNVDSIEIILRKFTWNKHCSYCLLPYLNKNKRSLKSCILLNRNNINVISIVIIIFNCFAYSIFYDKIIQKSVGKDNKCDDPAARTWSGNSKVFLRLTTIFWII